MSYVKIIHGRFKDKLGKVLVENNGLVKILLFPERENYLTYDNWITAIDCPVQINAIKLLYEKESNAK